MISCATQAAQLDLTTQARHVNQRNTLSSGSNARTAEGCTDCEGAGPRQQVGTRDRPRNCRGGANHLELRHPKDGGEHSAVAIPGVAPPFEDSVHGQAPPQANVHPPRKQGRAHRERPRGPQEGGGKCLGRE